MTTDELKTLKELRTELLLGVEAEELIYIRMQINRLDTLIYEASTNNNELSELFRNFIRSNHLSMKWDVYLERNKIKV